MFSPDLKHVSQHLFEKKDGESLESIIFDSGVALEVEQTGCDEIRQEFRFTALGNRQNAPDSTWAKEAVRQLVFLSSLGPKQKPLKMWADALEQVRPELKLGEAFTLETGISVRVDKIVSPEQSVILLVLSQKME
jgi:hypothetical protein